MLFRLNALVWSVKPASCLTTLCAFSSQLIIEGHIEQTSCFGGRDGQRGHAGNTLSVTVAGKQWLASKRDLQLRPISELRLEEPTVPPKAGWLGRNSTLSRRASSGQGSGAAIKEVRAIPIQRATPIISVPDAEKAAKEDELYNKLLEWRRRMARQRDIAPFNVCSNHTLQDLATRRPLTEAAVRETVEANARFIQTYAQQIM